jgi:two-component system, NtrC family, response regulator AtoC
LSIAGEGFVRPLLLVLTVMRDAKSRAFTKLVLEGAGHRVVEAVGVTQACSLLSNGLDPDLIVCEGLSPDLATSQSHRQLLRCVSAARFCVVAGVGEQALRQEASRLGIQHFVAKPVTRDDLEALIEAMSGSCGEPATSPSGASSDAVNLSPGTADSGDGSRIPMHIPGAPYVEELGSNGFFLAASPQMLEIHRQVKLLADIDVNVLILGESGTGKEVVAQLIHKNSRRSREKFMKVNCAALPTDLLESELFGHRQGAFTGAINDRQGKFEQANRGTLLLDEIGEIGVQMQAKLLHVLQDGQFARLGAQETTKVDVRVLAATNVQIEDALLEKTFREDLYYRLSVFTIKVPPLRERREEIPFLIEQMLRRTPQEMTHGSGFSLPSGLIDVALLYDWRGNVRELRNFVTRTIIMRDTAAAARELEEKVEAMGDADRCERAGIEAFPCVGIRSVVRDVKDRTEVQMIQNALEANGWNRRRAAQSLNISYRALLYKIQQHHLRPASVQNSLPVFPDSRGSRKNTRQRIGSEATRA